ncbi:MAG: ubiquitin-like domain-containing protein, partial [Chloroflexia bacterium]
MESARTDEPHDGARHVPRRRGNWLLLLAGVGLLWIGYRATLRDGTVTVDGTTIHFRTHHRLTGAVLAQIGIDVGPADEVFPPLQAPWQTAHPIVLRRAR